MDIVTTVPNIVQIQNISKIHDLFQGISVIFWKSFDSFTNLKVSIHKVVFGIWIWDISKICEILDFMLDYNMGGSLGDAGEVPVM